jgi:hypothetical protein
MTRREWMEVCVLVTVAWRLSERSAAARQRSAREAVDHLLLGAPDLDAGVAWLEQKTGVKATTGGSHPGVGTRNALASLGAGQYLEVIAPDPAQTQFNFQIDLRKLPEPRLITWAASSADLDATAAAARAAGYKVFGPRDGSRKRPDETVLRWRSLGVLAGFAQPDVDPMPFFIQWAADAKHPSTDSPSGCRLTAFGLQHPEPMKLQDALARLGIQAMVEKSEKVGLQATLETPKGKVNL